MKHKLNCEICLSVFASGRSSVIFLKGDFPPVLNLTVQDIRNILYHFSYKSSRPSKLRHLELQFGPSFQFTWVCILRFMTMSKKWQDFQIKARTTWYASSCATSFAEKRSSNDRPSFICKITIFQAHDASMPFYWAFAENVVNFLLHLSGEASTTFSMFA